MCHATAACETNNLLPLCLVDVSKLNSDTALSKGMRRAWRMGQCSTTAALWQTPVCTSHVLYEVWRRLTTVWLLPIWHLFCSSLRMLFAAQCACTRTWSMEAWTRYTCIARRGGTTSRLPCSDGLWQLSASKHTQLGWWANTAWWPITILQWAHAHRRVDYSHAPILQAARKAAWYNTHIHVNIGDLEQQQKPRCAWDAKFWLYLVHARPLSIPACWLLWAWCASTAAPWRRAGQERQRHATDVPRLPFQSLQAFQKGLTDCWLDAWMDGWMLG